MNALTTEIIAAPPAEPPVLVLPDTTTFDQWLDIGRALAELLRYEPETGKLYWRPRPRSLFASDRIWKTWNTRYAGEEAFTSRSGSGYFHGAIFGKTFTAHRVAWAIAYGRWPENDIDHIDGDKGNNALANLRDVSPGENHKNMSRATNNRSGFTGVHWCNTWNRWIAKIKVEGKTTTLGQFVNLEDAIAARAKANEEMGFASGHGKEPVR